MTRTNLQGLIFSATLLAASHAQAAVQTINFDNDASGNPISAPSLFSGATALTNLYADIGVNFSALSRTQETSTRIRDGIEVTQAYNVINPAATGMGAILDESSNFGSNAKSGDNFLAFNRLSSSSANLWRVSFDNPIGYFGISYSAGSASTTYQYLNFQAYDADGRLIGVSNYNYLGYTDANNTYYSSRFFDKAFRSETGISYIDIGQGLNCCSNNLDASFSSGNWSVKFDDLIFGEFSDAPTYLYNLSGNNGGYVPVPASIWMMLSGLMVILGCGRKQPNHSL
ncbi:MAG: hypothetical protein PHH11_17285 [Methylomonas sp.]|nr:hypothetical protein [Methylomonas sp.]